MSTDRLALAGELLNGALRDARQRLAKAERPYADKARQKAMDAALAGLEESLARYFDEMATRLLPVAKATAFTWDPDDADWAGERQQLREVLGAWWVYLGEAAYDAAGGELGIDLPFDVDRPGVKRILNELGQHVTDITEVSQAALKREVALAIERGYSLQQLVNGVDDGAFRGLRAMVTGWGSPDSRAMVIARTETATAYSLSSVNAYRDSGVVDKVEVLDGDGDAECAAANGQIWTLAYAEAHPIEHPNCVRAFAPVVSG